MKQKRHISIKDIAREAGVSYSTVSRALHDSPLIRPDVRHNVRDLAAAMGYSPNLLAQSLRSRFTKSIGLVITSISDPFLVDIVDGVDEIARQSGITVLLATTHNDPESEINIIEVFKNRRVDGVIVAASRLGQPYSNRLEQIDIPVILINNESLGYSDNIYSISMDDGLGAELAIRFLIGLGHSRIGYLGVKNREKSNRSRLEGFQRVMSENNLQVRDQWIEMDAGILNEDFHGDVCTGQLLSKRLLNNNLTALFCYCDAVAAGALITCREKNISVPGELSIIGFDNNELCEIVSPQLTTIAQPKREMGRAAMEMMMDLIRGNKAEDVVFQPTIIERQSTAPIRSQ